MTKKTTNYTDPEKEQHIDTPNDWLFGALLFARGLALAIPEDYGIVVDLQGDMITQYPYAKRVILAHMNKQVKVLPADERSDLQEGTVVFLLEDDVKKVKDDKEKTTE